MMKKMRVELKVNLRGKKQLWPEGTVFDSEDGPFPTDIEAEVASLKKGESENRVIRVLPLVSEQEEGLETPRRGRPPKRSALDAITGGDDEVGA